ncbi:MAG: putative amino-acid metabolite efflux pump [Paracidovorax wautersii]|uniref:Putative amino-acid metabolite efflux pump n=1 Tax=Paracidovorax wautersii TaxID=1177982 RepID=A0A7V8FQS4_9BURK|nr:MAG: putative amino-acid metabolite efflux pump [Paracidovorax wautersii]
MTAPRPAMPLPSSIAATAPVLFLLLWSSGFVFLKVGLAYADPLTFLALRYTCVVGLLLVACLALRPTLRLPAAWKHLAMVGLLIQAGYFACTYLSLKLGLSAGTLALITSQQPILIALLAPWVAHERVGLLRWAGLALGVAGAAIVIASKSTLAIGSATGLAFAVLALLCMTSGTLWEKRFGTAVHPVTANLVQYAVGLAVTAPLAFWLEPMHVEWTPALLGSLAYLVLANSLLAISLLLAMIRRAEASRVSALFFLVPPVTAVIAWLVLGETLPPQALPGMALAAAGIYLATRPAR